MCDKIIDYMKSKFIINYYRHKLVHVIFGAVAVVRLSEKKSLDGSCEVSLRAG